jgi:hypothetical protein
MMNRKLTWLAALAACFVLMSGTGGAATAATPMQIAFTNAGTPIAGGQVVLFFSNAMVSATADQSGVARFSVEAGKLFWIEVNGQRLAKVFSMTEAPTNVDIASIGTIVWRGKR